LSTPTQFDKKEDFLKYPKSLDKDLELLKQAGCDLVFTPASKNLYPEDAVSAAFDFGGIEKGDGRQVPRQPLQRGGNDCQKTV
jgi:pantothenate synthetase